MSTVGLGSPFGLYLKKSQIGHALNAVVAGRLPVTVSWRVSFCRWRWNSTWRICAMSSISGEVELARLGQL